MGPLPESLKASMLNWHLANDPVAQQSCDGSAQGPPCSSSTLQTSVDLVLLALVSHDQPEERQEGAPTWPMDAAAIGSISKSATLSCQSLPSSSRSTFSSCFLGMMSAPARTRSIAAWNCSIDRTCQDAACSAFIGRLSSLDQSGCRRGCATIRTLVKVSRCSWVHKQDGYQMDTCSLHVTAPTRMTLGC